jgi:hypothetical protein
VEKAIHSSLESSKIMKDSFSLVPREWQSSEKLRSENKTFNHHENIFSQNILPTFKTFSGELKIKNIYVML